MHCLLSQQPVTEKPGTSPAQVQQDLAASMPAGVKLSDGQTLEVKQGTVVLQAADASFNPAVSFGNAAKEFYVLRDNVALQGTDITNPAQGTDQSGSPDVQFSFTGNGQNEFQNVTAAIAHRGQLVSAFHQSLNQHFAVALDNKLITVPQIDFRTYPDGITGGGGADITGGFTIQSAQDLATQLRLGALPINLKLISESQVSATLGKQSLHQGLIAGAIGLLVVALFLIAYYRVLGLIAVAALITYSLYFYALIKLIPITLTLPGIAGLILTIGVAADANIVIFERVKEEIRAGRSIRSGIATGYKKGLTAIIDANVVTIMTAFILFVLATAEVQGFAFVLGIGTIVSLFTAVLATQAILMSMGDSRTIGRRSALGVGETPRVWRFDFMGASKYFFSMSGVILLIGALAIGGRGLNLGIDFTSGTRITANLVKPASQAQVSAVLSGAGAPDAQVQQVSNPALGAHVFQISAKHLSSVTGVQSALQSHFGLKSTDRLQHDRAQLRADDRQQRGDRDHRVAARHLGLRRAALPVEVRRAGADRPDARSADHRGRLLAHRPGGDDVDGRGAADHLGLLALRHDHRVRPCTREHPADAARRLLADRQPLDERGADAIDRHHRVHADADRRAAAVRRRDAAGLRLRADDRSRLGRVLVDLHRLAGAHALEGARVGLPPSPRPDRRRARQRRRLRVGRLGRRPGP